MTYEEVLLHLAFQYRDQITQIKLLNGPISIFQKLCSQKLWVESSGQALAIRLLLRKDSAWPYREIRSDKEQRWRWASASVTKPEDRSTAAFPVTVSVRKLERKDQRLTPLYNSGNLYQLSSLLLWWFLDSFSIVISIRPLTTRKACLLTFQGNTELGAEEATSFKPDWGGKFPRDGKSYGKERKQGM